jgi:hypothetical protein
MQFTQKIDVVEDISSSAFRKNYLKAHRPVVIKGLAKNTVAGSKWSIDYFKSTMGDIEVDVFDNGNKKASASAYTSPDLKMKFADYLEIISKNEHTDLRIFLFNLFKFNPALRKEFPCPGIMRGLLDGMGFMFFGGKDTTVRIHYDIDMSDVLHTHFGGRKRVVLISPDQNDLMYRLPLNTYSLIDIDKPDYEKYPALRLVQASEVILEDGDSIFMPGGYWHYMTYLEGSFSVSYRKLAGSFKNRLAGLLNLALYMPIDKLLNKIMGSRWLQIKKNIATKRANQKIARHYPVDLEQPLGI